MAEYILKVPDIDDCPKSDNVIKKDDCTYCEFFEGKKEYNELSCVMCSFSEK